MVYAILSYFTMQPVRQYFSNMFLSGYYLLQNYQVTVKNKLQAFNTQYDYALSLVDGKL